MLKFNIMYIIGHYSQGDQTGDRATGTEPVTRVFGWDTKLAMEPPGPSRCFTCLRHQVRAAEPTVAGLRLRPGSAKLISTRAEAERRRGGTQPFGSSELRANLPF